MNRLLTTSYMIFIYFLLYLPIVVLVIFSFNDSVHSGLWHGTTSYWYKILWHDSDLQIVAGHSLLVSLLAATGATLIGTLGAFALFKYHFMGKRLLGGVIFIMIVIPDLVQAIALLIGFHAFHVSLGFSTLLLSHITFCIPFVIMVIMGRMAGTNKHLFEAAKDLGANDILVFRKIIVPLMMPAIIAGWMLSFTLSFDDVIISSFVTGPDFQILPLYIFSAVKLGVTPEINALCTVILGLTVVAALIAQVMMRKKHA